MTTTTLPIIKSFHCDTDGTILAQKTELNICISVADALTAASVLGNITLLCAQYKFAGLVPTQASTDEPAPAATGPVDESPLTGPSAAAVFTPSTDAKLAKVAPSAVTTTKRTAAKAKPTAKKAPTNKGSGAVTDATKAAINPVAATPATEKPAVGEPAAKAVTDPKPAADGVDVPDEIKTAHSFSQVLLWMGQNVGQDFDAITTRIQQYRSQSPAIQRIDTDTAKVRQRVETGITVLIARGTLKAA